MNIQTLTSENFDEVVAKNDFLLIDFWATWCAPCKTFAKVIEKVAPEFSHVLFAKVDIEQESALAKEFSIRCVPSVMIIRHQAIVYADSGALSEASLKEILNKAKNLNQADT